MQAHNYLKILCSFLILSYSCNSNAQNLISEFQSVEETIEFKGYLFFTAGTSQYGKELWKSDGTDQGTVIVKDILLGKEGSDPSNFYLFENFLFFTANDAKNGRELWISDGTEAGTKLFYNLLPGDKSIFVRSFFTFKNELIFIEDSNLPTLYKVDLAGEKIECFQSSCAFVTNYHYFSIEDQLYLHNNYNEFISIFNPTTEKFDKITFSESINVSKISLSGDQIFIYDDIGKLFVYSTSNQDLELLQEWSTDTYGKIEIGEFEPTETRLFFTVRLNHNLLDDEDQLWVSDGTSDGTTLLRSVPWNPHLFRDEMVALNSFEDNLYFIANNNDSPSLWVSDGSVNGTKQINNIKPSKQYDVQNSPRFWGNKLYFLTAWNTFGIYDTSIDQYLRFDDPLDNLQLLGEVNDLYFFAMKGQLWTTDVDARIHAEQEKLSFGIYGGIKIDSCTTREARIKNLGHQVLQLAEISSSAGPFYLKAPAQDHILPGQELKLEIAFFPETDGVHKGELIIASTDGNEPFISIELDGRAINEVTEDSLCFQSVSSFTKYWRNEGGGNEIQITNNRIIENNLINAFVGRLFIEETSEDYQYQVTNDGNEADLFSIKGDSVFLNSSIDYEKHKYLSLEIKAFNEIDTIENYLLVYVDDVHESIEDKECATYLKRLDQALRSVVYLDGETIMAVGDKGTVVKSEDNGKNWLNISLHESADLREIINIGVDTIIVMADRYLLRSFDQGNKWHSLVISESTQSMQDISSPIDSIGFVLVNQNQVFKTTDFGNQWELAIKFDQSLSKIEFLDEKVGLIGTTDGSIYLTTNGGYDWILLKQFSETNGETISYIKLFDASQFIVANRMGRVYKTSDGGITWSEIAGDISGKKAFRMKNLTEGHFFVEFSGIYETTDGNNWQLVFESKGSTHDFSYSKNGQSIAVGSSERTYNYDALHPLIINNDVNDWESVSFFDPTGELDRVFWIEPDKALKLNSQGEFYLTKNKGVTWLPISYPELAYVKDVLTIDENKWFIVTSNNIHVTTNQGTAWNTIPNDREIALLTSPNSNILIASGDNENTLLKSTDDAMTWSVVNVTAYDVNRLNFINGTIGFLLDSSQKLMRTDDGGESWNTIYDGMDDVVYNYQFLDPSLGFVRTWNAGIFKTTDGGNTWSKVIRNNNVDDGIDFRFIDEFTAFAPTRKGLLKTSDGGQNWYCIERIPGYKFRVTANSQNELYYLSDEGVFAHLETEKQPITPGNFSGSTNVVLGDPYYYESDFRQDTDYNWSAIGGTILRQSGNQVWIIWNDNNAKQLSLRTKNACGDYMEITQNVKETKGRFTLEEEEIITSLNSVESGRFTIYPNPASHQLNITLPTDIIEPVTLRITTVNGKVITKTRISRQQKSVNLITLKQGVYIVQLIAKDYHYVARFIKN